MPAPKLFGNLANLRSVAAHYVKEGLQPDSLRKHIYRQKGSVSGVPWRQAYQSAVEDFANEAVLAEGRGNLKPRPGRDMVGREFKAPYRYRYVGAADVLDSEGNVVGQKGYSAYSDVRLTKTQAQGLLWHKLNDALEPTGKYGIEAGQQLAEMELKNAYYNIADVEE